MLTKIKCLLIAVLLIQTISIKSGPSSAMAAGISVRNVVAVFPVTIDAFTRFQEEMQRVLSQDSIRVIFLSAEGDPSRFQTVIDAALLKNPDILVTVGTQLTNVGLSPKYEHSLPIVVSTCISDPQVVETLVSLGLEPPRKKAVAIILDTPKQDPYEYGASIIKITTPDITKAGVLYNNSELNSKFTASKITLALQKKGLTVIDGVITGEEDVEKVAENLILKGAQLLIVPHDKYVVKKTATLVKLGLEAPGKSVPVYSLDDGGVRKDGAAYGVSVEYADLGRITGELVLRIKNGEDPANVPIIRVEEAKAYFNLDSWKALKLPEIPKDVLSNSIVFKKDE